LFQKTLGRRKSKKKQKEGGGNKEWCRQLKGGKREEVNDRKEHTGGKGVGRSGNRAQKTARLSVQ